MPVCFIMCSMDDTPKKMMKSAASFFSGTMLSRVTGMLRDMSMAFAFGTEASLAAFFVAFRFAHLLRRLFGEGTLQSAFIPHFESLRQQESSPNRSIRLFADLYAALSLILVVIIGIGMGLCFLLGQSDLQAGSLEIINLSSLMLPSLLFICLAGLNTAFLQCERSYFLPAVSPVAFNLIWIIGVFFLQAVSSEQAMPKLALFIVLACFFQWIVTLPKVLAILHSYGGGFRLLKEINPLSSDLKQLWRPFFLGMIGIGAAQINSACDAIFARYAESAGPAFLWYAIRLQQLPLALFGIALSGALLPPLTRAIKEGELARAQLLLQVAVHRSMLLILPITAALFLFGHKSIDLIYGYGGFNSDSLWGTTYCLWGYSLGLIPMVLVLIAAPVFYAQGDYKTPTYASLGAMLLNLLLNALLVWVFNFGAFSIAMATSLSAWLNLIWLVLALGPLFNKSFFAGIAKIFSDIGLALSLACAASYLLSCWLPAGDSFMMKSFYLGLLGLPFLGCFLKKNYQHWASENL